MQELTTMWYKLANPDFKSLDPEEFSEEGRQADQVFQENKIRPSSYKNVTQVAVENGVVIGALASGWDKTNGYGSWEKDVMVFDFDLVVKPEFRRQGVGLKLIQQAIAQYNQEKMDYQEMGSKTMMRVRVINPVLIPVLERLGFKVESTHKDGSAYLEAY